MQEKHLQDPAVLGLLNSLMSSYELPTLFSNEELEGLFQALAPSIKRDMMLLNAMADHWLHPGGPKKETGSTITFS